jgi:hypothetical protein
MHPALAADLLEAFQLGEGIGVVVDAQVEVGPLFLAMDQQRRRLLAPLVAAGRFARFMLRSGARKRQFFVRGLAALSITCAPASMLPAMESPRLRHGRYQSTHSRPVCAAMPPAPMT